MATDPERHDRLGGRVDVAVMLPTNPGTSSRARDDATCPALWDGSAELTGFRNPIRARAGSLRVSCPAG